jgi:hypothetical protein
MKLLSHFANKRTRTILLTQCVRVVELDRATQRLRDGYGLNTVLPKGKLVNEVA